MVWTGKILLGSFFTKINVVFDTGSDWLVVQGISCESCEGAKFDPSYSTQTSNSDIEARNYGSASLLGYEYNDKVCLNPSFCVLNFDFFLVQNQTGLHPPVEGILGMSQN